MFAYSLPNVDYYWEFSRTVKETISILVEGSEDICNCEYLMSFKLEVFMSAWKEARRLAKVIGWDGSFRRSPGVFTIPNAYGFLYGFAFQQENNGPTYVICPVPLPHLNEACIRFYES